MGCQGAVGSFETHVCCYGRDGWHILAFFDLRSGKHFSMETAPVDFPRNGALQLKPNCTSAMIFPLVQAAIAVWCADRMMPIFFTTSSRMLKRCQEFQRYYFHSRSPRGVGEETKQTLEDLRLTQQNFIPPCRGW